MKFARVFAALTFLPTGVAPLLAADAPPVPVVVTTARAENFSATLQATGTVVSRNDARISGEVGGTLAWIAEPGVNVKRGDIIARIDRERLSLTLRDNQAAVKRLEAQLQLLATQRGRLQTLGNVVSQSQLEEALSREHMAEQDVEQARVARDRARLDLDRATVRAPFDGIVAERLQHLNPRARHRLAMLIDDRAGDHAATNQTKRETRGRLALFHRDRKAGRHHAFARAKVRGQVRGFRDGHRVAARGHSRQHEPSGRIAERREILTAFERPQHDTRTRNRTIRSIS